MRLLTGIQSTGVPHLGNILGAIRPMIERSRPAGVEAFAFIADLHSLTALRDAHTRLHNTRAVAAAWLACGFDTSRHVFYRQSRVPQVCELMWYLACLAPYPMLANAHSFKDKSARLAEVNAGLFTYPVLMAADILLFDAEKVPVGKDQIQHLEITRDLAHTFNRLYEPLFVVPAAEVDAQVKVIPGTDGQKMSKSYNNTINIFLEEKALRKSVMSIITDSTPLELPKNPDTCTVFKLFALVAPEEETQELRSRYLAGGFGYGQAKNLLFEKLLDTFREERRRFSELMAHPEELDRALAQGEEKARQLADDKLRRIRECLGF
ncbi:MAG: tryptophan--tRNA ligase [Flavobacteriales bacterium]|nr:tryptophan--tRNA ligase [Flavobacteriales bacterium]MCX7650504.1 tryptophan--tRNA ligase [Flavobacteriales bacterium]MDW8432607.1 tryptophan--tRNA ligase [Flavobacteriales bacterium]